MTRRRAELRTEIRRRADAFLAQDRLEVDYYRIRRRISYPLPVRRIENLPMPMMMDLAGLSYPWSTWLIWQLEERIHCLGWAGEWFADRRARAVVARDLAALASWPTFRQYEKPDLLLGHTARILFTAYTRWRWLKPAVRSAIAKALARMLADNLPLCDGYYGAWSSTAEIVALAEPRPALHNIPFIGTIGLALAAHALGHDSREHLDRRLHVLYGALLQLLDRGFTEGLSYDGYILDFLAMWLRELPPAQRAPIVDHPRFPLFFEESYRLSAPGDALQVAELSDVEPAHMPFHATAHAKCLALRSDPRLSWYLERCDVRRLRGEALAELAEAPAAPAARTPAAGALDAHYALVLRSGWDARDLAVAISCTTSPMHHMHHDDGTIVIGTAGRWLIADPGYQQYLQKKEREFTLGPAAHNAPVINGRAQNAKTCRRLALERSAPGIFRAELDLTSCYPSEAGVDSMVRTVWLAGRDLVVVGDRISGAAIASVRYHWHAHPEAGWWWQDGAAMIRCGETTAWMSSPGMNLSPAEVDRLPGSRGQLTLSADIPPPKRTTKARTHWWIFSFGRRPQPVVADGDSLRVGARRFSVG
jgi:hypothetical protein